MSKPFKKATTRRPARERTEPIGGHRPVDEHVGARLRQRRTLLGISQTALGDNVGLTFQQIQKYERGANRIGASRLFEFSNVLDVPIQYFYDEMPFTVKRTKGRHSGVDSQIPSPAEKGDPLVRRETLELVRSYYKINEPKVRKRLFELVKATGSALQASP